jgi:DNA-binding transcriptional ArsR family regulator
VSTETEVPESLQHLLDLDRTIHEPARLVILTILSSAAEVEFKFLETATGMSKGNISSHTAKLEAAGYIEVHKAFRGKVPVTSFTITASGRAALEGYWVAVKAATPTL